MSFDVREPTELPVELVPGAVTIPLVQLTARLSELRDREVLTVGRFDQRAHTATRILRQGGFELQNLSGSMPSRAIYSLD